MEPGQRDRWVEIKTIAQTTGASRFPVDDEQLLAGMWASKYDIQGAEKFAADQVSATVDTRWEISYRTDMDPELVDVPKTRVLYYKGRRYNIVVATMIGRREGVELLTLAQVG